MSAAFQRAKALPAGEFATAVKREVEPDAIEGLIACAGVAQAATEAAGADGGAAEIESDLITALLAQHSSAAAWDTWAHYPSGQGAFAFRAATELLHAPGAAAAKAAVLQSGESAAAQVGDLTEAAEATDFLEAAAQSNAAPAPPADAARSLAGTLQAVTTVSVGSQMAAPVRALP